jgi:uncharacterized protein YndB with AHSA1/START domain
MIRKAALALFLLITFSLIALLAIAATRPATYHVERSVTVAAPPQVVFAIVNDLRRYPEWSPWQRLDPAMTSAIEGSGVGPGSAYTWRGNDQVGEGRMTITASVPASDVALRLEFLKPWQATSDVHLRFQPEGGGSRVTWAIDGGNNYMAKLMTLFVSMDSLLGRDFDSGLANLKRLSEHPPAQPAATAGDSTATR